MKFFYIISEAAMTTNRRQVNAKDLKPDMILAEPIYDVDGKTLFSEGLRLNEKRIERMLSLDKETFYIEDTTYVPKKEVSLVKESTTLFEEKASQRRSILLNETREDAAELVGDMLDKVLDDHSMKAEKIKKIVERMISVILSDEKVVLNLSNLSAIDDYLMSHCVNVCVLSLVTGVCLGLTQVKLMQLGSGALIHDIGKMLVPQDIYNKPDRLTDDEYSEIKHHTLYGFKILKDTLAFENDAANIALYHHERMDGKGYPNGLTKNEIPLFAKIVGVTDVFDALTTDRVYCEKIDYYKGVLYLIENSGSQFDVEIVKKFITMIGYYPIGLLVKLNTGDIGRVMNKNKLCPLVRIVKDSNGNVLQNYYEIDLYKNPSISIIDLNIDEFNSRKA